MWQRTGIALTLIGGVVLGLSALTLGVAGGGGVGAKPLVVGAGVAAAASVTGIVLWVIPRSPAADVTGLHGATFGGGYQLVY